MMNIIFISYLMGIGDWAQSPIPNLFVDYYLKYKKINYLNIY